MSYNDYYIKDRTCLCPKCEWTNCLRPEILLHLWSGFDKENTFSFKCINDECDQEFKAKWIVTKTESLSRQKEDEDATNTKEDA